MDMLESDGEEDIIEETEEWLGLPNVKYYYELFIKNILIFFTARNSLM